MAKHVEKGHLDITRINRDGVVMFGIQNLPDTPTDSGLHYNSDNLVVTKEEALTLIDMLSEELGLTGSDEENE